MCAKIKLPLDCCSARDTTDSCTTPHSLCPALLSYLSSVASPAGLLQGLKRKRPLRPTPYAPPAKRRRGRHISAPKGKAAVRAAAEPPAAAALPRGPSSAVPQVLREAEAVDARQQLKAAAGLGSVREVFTGSLQAQPWPTIWRDGRFAPLPELVALCPHPAADAKAEAWAPLAMAGNTLQVSPHMCCYTRLFVVVIVWANAGKPQLNRACWASLLPLWPTPATVAAVFLENVHVGERAPHDHVLLSTRVTADWLLHWCRVVGSRPAHR